jgi:hypothetical protein
MSGAGFHRPGSSSGTTKRSSPPLPTFGPRDCDRWSTTSQAAVWSFGLWVEPEMVSPYSFSLVGMGFEPYCVHACPRIWHEGRFPGSPGSEMGFDEAG